MTKAQWLATPGDTVSGEFAAYTHPGQAGAKIALTAFVLAILCVETALFVAFVGKIIGIGWYGVLHVGGCLAIGLAWWWVTTRTQNAQITYDIPQILAWTMFAGPFGATISVALLMPARPQGPATEASNPQPPKHSGPRHERLRAALLDQHVRLQNAHLVRPLLDVIAEGTQPEKFEALTVIAKSYEPSLAPTLRLALADESAPVRVLAATVMAKLRMSYFKKVGALQAEVATAPNRAEALRRLADARIALAESGLLDSPRAREELAKAQEELARAAGVEVRTAS